MRTGIGITVTASDRDRLGAMAAPREPAEACWRARIALLTDDGLGTSAIIAATGEFKTCVWRGQERFMAEGVRGSAARQDSTSRQGTGPGAARRRYRPPDTATAAARSDPLHGARDGEGAGVAASTVQAIWKAHGLSPHRWRSFKLSNGPAFAEKLTEIVGLYVDPPVHAVVLSFDEKSQIQALDRTQPGLPMKKGRAGTMTHDYKRHGTTTLFAALNVLDGTVIGQNMQRLRPL
jgi:hypothetical protein